LQRVKPRRQAVWQRFVKIHECLIPDRLFVVDMMSLLVEDQQPVQALDSIEHRPARARTAVVTNGSRAAQRRIVPWPPNLSSWPEPVGNVRRHRSHLGRR
jgi:hypothetical protein